MDPSVLLSFAAEVATTFLTVSYMSAAATEGLSSAFQARARLLLRGILQLLGETQHRAPITLRIYTNYTFNPLFNPATADQPTSLAQVTPRPAAVESKTFASVLMDTVGLTGNTPERMRASVRAAFSENRDLIPLAENLIDRHADEVIQGNLVPMQTEVANWFDRSTFHTRDEYRRLTQISNFVIALLIAVLLGVNPLPEALVQNSPNPMAARILGYLVVAISTLFGAPFWYGLLTKITSMSSGTPPPEMAAPPPGAGAPAAAAPGPTLTGPAGPPPATPPAPAPADAAHAIAVPVGAPNGPGASR